MSEKLERCPFCGGEAFTHMLGNEIAKGYYIACDECGAKTIVFGYEAEAIEAWNRRSERTAKVKEAVPNMTILKRKVDLQSILQAIKTDKIRVWMSYDGKIRFRNTKTGNEIGVNPYYDMEGDEYHE